MHHCKRRPISHEDLFADPCGIDTSQGEEASRFASGTIELHAVAKERHDSRHNGTDFVHCSLRIPVPKYTLTIIHEAGQSSVRAICVSR